jgi:hypothetical protein
MRNKILLTDACLSEKEAAGILFFLIPENMEYFTQHVITVNGVLTK